MSDFPGCACGHPYAEPSWIDHAKGCVYESRRVAVIDAMLDSGHTGLGKCYDGANLTDVADLVLANLDAILNGDSDD